MSNTPFMQFYVADYLADTQHLTTEQHGAYLLLLMTMWRNGGSLPNDDKKLARIARISLKRWHLIVDDVMNFFDVDGEIITQKRLVEELQKAVSKSEKRKTSGSLGGKAKSLKYNNVGLANATDLPKHLSEPESDTDNKKDISNDISKKTEKEKNGFRLPDNFVPDLSAATKRGFPLEEAKDMAENFCDYWQAETGQKSRKLDWSKAWNVWVRNSRPPKQKPLKSREEEAEDFLYAQLH